MLQTCYKLILKFSKNSNSKLIVSNSQYSRLLVGKCYRAFVIPLGIKLLINILMKLLMKYLLLIN